MRKFLVVIAITSFLGAACATAPKTPAPSAEATPVAADPTKALFSAKCAGCHGTDAAKLKGKDTDYLVNALNGYKAKTYGGAKKQIMESRAALLTDTEILALGKLIPTL